jgi:hypothetical protein
MSRTPRSLALFFLAAASLAACNQKHVASPDSAAASLRAADEIVFGFELKHACKLQQNRGDVPAADALPKDWDPLDPQPLANRPFKILSKKTIEGGALSLHPTISIALELSDERDNTVMWVRNQPALSSDEATQDWSCAFDREAVVAAMPKLRAPVVELAFSGNQCTTITPIFGDVNNLTFSPYTVTGRTLFATAQGPVIGIRVEAQGGEKALTVPSRVLDQCFVPADRPPPPPQETDALVLWLGSPNTSQVPAVSIDTTELLTGLRLERCMRDGTGLTTHWECRNPILEVAPSKQPGPFGPPVIHVERDRVVDAVHFYAKRLISPADVVSINAAVRLHAAAAVTRSFNAEIDKALADPEAKARRSANGFRLLRASDVAGGIAATHYVDLEVTADVPQTNATTEQRVQKYVRGKKTIANPKYAELVNTVTTKTQEVASAKTALDNAQALAKQAGAAASKLCESGANQAASSLPFGLGSVVGSAAGSACNAGAQKVVAAAEQATFDRTTKELADAQAALDTTPKNVTVDDEAEFPFEAKVYRRSGDATAQVTVSAAGGQKELATTVTFHFEASDDEYPASPEHNLTAKTAKVPTDDDVYRQLAGALIQRADEAVIKWAAQRQIGGDIGDLQPGTRSWMVAVARHAASDRSVKLLSDLLETRSEELEKPVLEYPVKMPSQSSGRCFTFAAIPMTPGVNVNLYLVRKGEDGSMDYARDTRKVSDAAFELCDMAAGDYAIRIKFADKTVSSKGVLVSMFDSTPGAATSEDTIAASRGIPTKPRKGEELVLNGEGIVQYVGLNNKMVTGKTGDRDGDGIPDDDDRCPYDPETKNGYLDEDGCPDVAPPGWDGGATSP